MTINKTIFFIIRNNYMIISSKFSDYVCIFNKRIKFYKCYVVFYASKILLCKRIRCLHNYYYFKATNGLLLAGYPTYISRQ